MENNNTVMKRILPIAMLLLAVFTGSMRESAPEGALYLRYASSPEVAVAQVSDFSLNDTVQVDVVLLQAESDEAWQRMKEEFGIADTSGSTSWLGTTDEPARRASWNGQPLLRVIASHEKRAVGLYLLENEVQYDALMDYQLNRIVN